jgi:hypothetical protein
MAKKILICCFLILSILSVIGIYHIFSIRFKIGDVYPPYSSLRTDPVGTKIFFKSLTNMPGCIVERDYDPLPKWEGDKYTTLFLLGIQAGILDISDKETHRTLSLILSAGTRTVISIIAKKGAVNPDPEIDGEPAKEKKEKAETEHEEEAKKEEPKQDYSITRLLGFKIAPLKDIQAESAELFNPGPGVNLPASIKCRPSHYFTDLNDGWSVLYTQKGKPVVIFRKFGQGTIIFSADTYIFSNEAMMSDRYPRLLSWFIGSGKHIYFDESHFGIQKTTGMIDLVNKYRLQGVIAVFFLMAVLYFWKNATPFVPPQYNEDMNTKIIRAERDYLDGLVNLLQRYIPPGDLIKRCIREWEKASAQGKTSRPSRCSGSELEELAKNYKEPSQMYNSISKKLKERKPI